MMSLEEIRDSGTELLTARDAARGLTCSTCACACVLALGALTGDSGQATALAAYVASISAFIAGAAYSTFCEAGDVVRR